MILIKNYLKLIPFLIIALVTAYEIYLVAHNMKQDSLVKSYESRDKALVTPLVKTIDKLGKETTKSLSSKVGDPNELSRISPETVSQLKDLKVKLNNLEFYIKNTSKTSGNIITFVHDTTYISSDSTKSIVKSKLIKYNDEWTKLRVLISNDSIAKIQYSVKNSYRIAGSFKKRSILHLFKPRETEITIKNMNPHSETDSLSSIIVIPRNRLFGLF